MLKRGQVTLFIIIGLILILLTAVIYFVSTRDNSFLSKSVNEEEIQIDNYVDFCLKEVSREAIVLISSQGGYYQTPSPSIEFSTLQIPYYFHNISLNIPTKETIQNQLSLAIEENINNCLDDFKTFTFNLQKENPKVETIITSNKIIFNLNLDLYITTNKSQFTLNEFSYSQPVELGKAIELIPSIIKEQEKQPNKVRLSFLTKLGEKEKVMINMATLNQTVFYNLEYSNSEFNKEKYIFTFAMKYDW